MSATTIAWRFLRQDWRSGELVLLMIALVLTVSAVTAVGFFTDRVAGAMERQGSELIGADLVLEATAPWSPEILDEIRARGLALAETLEFRSVVIGEGGPQLVEVKAVDPAYPLRGALRTRADFSAPELVAATGPPPGEVWTDARLLRLLDLPVGATFELGEARPRLGAILSHEPDRGGSFIAFAPRVLMAREDIAATGLITPASRASYRVLVAGEPPAIESFRRWVEPRLPVSASLVDAREARPEFGTAVERASRFLHLASLATLLVAGAALALTSRRLVERQIDAVAVMRCLGAPRHLLTRIFLLRLLLLGLAASALGILLGWLAQTALVLLLAEWFSQTLPPPSLSPAALGLGIGLIALAGFAVPPLVQLARVSPLRALRRDLGVPRASAALTLGAALLALALVVIWQSPDFALAWRLLLAVVLSLLGLAAAVLLLVRLADRLSGRATGIWRLGLAALTRRPANAVLQISGLGLGILALLLLALVRVDLLRAWQETLPPGAPNHFLVNIPPDQVEPLRAFLADRELVGAELLPMIRGRLVRINAHAVEPSDYAEPRAERLAAREFNLSFSTQLSADNRIQAGEWLGQAPDQPQFSVESGIAETLGIALGDTLTFLVSGREVSAPVTSLRTVQWDSFNVNFFVIASPPVLRDETATYVTSFHLPAAQPETIPDLLRRFPAVTVLDVEAILAQVRQVIDRGALAVEAVFLFTLAAGVLVMFAGIQSGIEQRRAEQAVLRTLGARRRRLLAGLLVEFAATGLLAGLLASLFAELIGWTLATQFFGLSFSFNPQLWLVGVFGSAAFIALAGTAATYPLLIRPPLSVLRGSGP